MTIEKKMKVKNRVFRSNRDEVDKDVWVTVTVTPTNDVIVRKGSACCCCCCCCCCCFTASQFSRRRVEPSCVLFWLAAAAAAQSTPRLAALSSVLNQSQKAIPHEIRKFVFGTVQYIAVSFSVAERAAKKKQ